MISNIKRIKKMNSRGINYIVKPEIGLVVCILRDDPYTSWRGSAKCSPQDTFDEEKGKRIAFLRACAKRKRSELNDLRYQIDIINSDINYLDQKRNKFLSVIDSMKKSLGRYFEEIHNLGEQQ